MLRMKPVKNFSSLRVVSNSFDIKRTYLQINVFMLDVCKVLLANHCIDILVAFEWRVIEALMLLKQREKQNTTKEETDSTEKSENRKE